MSQRGVTFVELVVTMLVASIAVGFIGAAYVIAVRTWRAQDERLHSVRAAWRAAAAVDHLLADCTAIRQVGQAQWKLLSVSGDSTTLSLRAESLSVNGRRLAVEGACTGFVLTRDSAATNDRAWHCRLAWATKGRPTELAWRGVCEASDVSPRLLGVGANEWSTTGMYWDRSPGAMTRQRGADALAAVP